MAELRGVGLADHDRAGTLQPRDVGRADGGRPVPERLAPERVGHAGLEIEEVLDRDGDAVQGPQRRSRNHGLLGFAREVPRLVVQHQDVCVHGLVAQFDALEKGVYDVDRGQVAAPDAGGQLGCRHVGKLILHGHGTPF